MNLRVSSNLSISGHEPKQKHQKKAKKTKQKSPNNELKPEFLVSNVTFIDVCLIYHL